MCIVFILLQALGRHLVSFNCSESLTLHQINKYITGAIHAGCSALFDHSDKMTQGTYLITIWQLCLKSSMWVISFGCIFLCQFLDAYELPCVYIEQSHQLTSIRHRPSTKSRQLSPDWFPNNGQKYMENVTDQIHESHQPFGLWSVLIDCLDRAII